MNQLVCYWKRNHVRTVACSMIGLGLLRWLRYLWQLIRKTPRTFLSRLLFAPQLFHLELYLYSKNLSDFGNVVPMYYNLLFSFFFHKIEKKNRRKSAITLLTITKILLCKMTVSSLISFFVLAKKDLFFLNRLYI